MSVYYNENDHKAAAWLRQLMADGLIPEGEIDERSIREVKPDDVRGFTQCHFFAGIGGWARALELAGWGKRPVWSASCPCQPFSVAGQGKGEDDERNLWPDTFRLVRECGPEFCIGEQVSQAIGHGWLDGISADLERAHYAVGSIVLGAHSIGAPHKRQRLYWLAHAISGRRGARAAVGGSSTAETHAGDANGVDRMANTEHPIWRTEQQIDPNPHGRNGFRGGGDIGQPSVGQADALCARLEGHARNGDHGSEPGREPSREAGPASESGGVGGLGESNGTGRGAGRGTTEAAGHRNTAGTDGSVGEAEAHGCEVRPQLHPGDDGKGLGEGREYGFWSDFTVIQMRDGKSRRIPSVEPVLQCVVDGFSEGVDASGTESGFPLCEKIKGRVMLLKGYGNAIVPELAAEFIRAYMEVERGVE